ncbi:hypothetical protein Rhopal_002868-T1 [Rhodotorula paludigena]|uniref:MARVEL domain-containing protein n=1 Tax=Rhodotorula paludigena TaxID=86838 RepID=A0AAV5GIZ2_9BASI|nr:hypothetical protein Rhopal_002868-T1 [Rhodotorula paludigena]
MPSNLDAHIQKRGHITTFSILAVSSLITWFNDGGYPSGAIRDRTRFLLFTGLWTFVFTFVYIFGFLKASTSFLFSIASHAVWLFVTWVFWLAGAAAITASLDGGLSCGDWPFANCNQLNALEAFAWISWIIITIMLAFVLFAGARSARSGSGFGGPMVDV